MKKKDISKKTKFNIPLLLISIVLIGIAFFINSDIAIRPLLWIIGAILFIIPFINKYNLKAHTAIFLFVFIFMTSVVIDCAVVITFKKIPLFAYNIISLSNTKVYNGIGIRVWQCDKEDNKNLITDLFYNKGYMCDAEDIDVIDSNSFLNSVVENYTDYKNSYVKINGRISKKTGQNVIEMKPYETSSVTINGYVTFADNITLRLIFNDAEPELDNYDVYDEITVVGIVKNLENESGKYVIYMHDGKVVSSVNLGDYKITATEEQTCSESSIIYSNESNNVYSYCLEDIIVTYEDDKKYELATALSSGKITTDNLSKKSLKVEKSDEDNRTIYTYEEYSVLVCDQELSKDIIVGPKKMTFKDVTCNPKIEQ